MNSLVHFRVGIHKNKKVFLCRYVKKCHKQFVENSAIVFFKTLLVLKIGTVLISLQIKIYNVTRVTLLIHSKIVSSWILFSQKVIFLHVMSFTFKTLKKKIPYDTAQAMHALLLSFKTYSIGSIHFLLFYRFELNRWYFKTVGRIILKIMSDHFKIRHAAKS